ncbi:MAG: AraC family transcriptional regulator [Burkholderiales bacterium]
MSTKASFASQPVAIPSAAMAAPPAAAGALDVLSDLLRVVRLSGAVLFRGDLTTPWAFESMDSSQLARMLLPRAKWLALFHVVAKGRCWLKLPSGQHLELSQGDIVVLPYGDAHTMGSDGARGPVPVGRLLAENLQCSPGVPVVVYGGGGEATELVCGFVHCDELLFNPLLKGLPVAMHLSASDRPGRSLVATATQSMIEELRSARAGSACVLARLTELLFVEVLRQHMAALPPHACGWLSALNDPLLGRALALLHAQPAHRWTVDDLVRQLGTSRSVLAARFKSLLGQSPMHYLTCWRLQLAAQLLHDNKLALSAIAEQVGYESEPAFNRAFKRFAGEPPATWRANATAAPVAHAARPA